MPTDFNQYPLYDPVVGPDGKHLSNIWKDFLANDRQNLVQFLTNNSVIMPSLTTAQRDALENLKNGMHIYNTSLDTAQYYKESSGTWISY